MVVVCGGDDPGGVLDRIDALIPTLPLAVLLDSFL